MEISSNKRKARIAGLLYLVVVLTGMFSLAYVPSKLIVLDNASATVQNIIASELLFRLGIVAGLVCYTFFLFLPLALYQLLKSVDKNYARVMVILAVVSVPISFINIQNRFAVLSLISNPGEQEQVMFYLKQYNTGILILKIFWGLWLFPFGYLVFKSGFLPKVLGILLMAGCFGYLLDFLGQAIFPAAYGEMGISTFVRLPASIGEIGTCLWLLIMGAKERPVGIIF
jgi:hypothetical protein